MLVLSSRLSLGVGAGHARCRTHRNARIRGQEGLQQNDLSKEDVESLEKVPSITFVEFTGKSKGLSHGYFHTSPAVSSDLILSIRYEMSPGPQHGRPMQRRGTNFWAIDDSYPSNAGEH